MVKKNVKTHVNQAGIISVFEVVQNTGLVKTGKFSHVLDLVEFRRIHLLDIILGHGGSFAGLLNLDLDLIAPLALNAGGHEALRLVGHPNQSFLGPLRLCGRVIVIVPVHTQEFQFWIVTILRIGVSHG